jgi:hypothetical protein
MMGKRPSFYNMRNFGPSAMALCKEIVDEAQLNLTAKRLKWRRQTRSYRR